jgi:hypothetical protein
VLWLSRGCTPKKRAYSLQPESKRTQSFSLASP